jgi:hypothetical protein
MSAKMIQTSTSPPKTKIIMAEGVIFAVSGGVAAARLRAFIFTGIGRNQLFLRDGGNAGQVVTVAIKYFTMVYKILGQ